MQVFPIQSLLQQVLSLNERYKKINELTGENFNIFRVLKMETSEVKMHSAFLATLLDPNGSHGQKGVFLRLFIETCCFKGNSIDVDSCKVAIEKHSGFINEDRSEGGRIDILITDRHNNQIVIENKIYAADQDKQLLRYHNYSKRADLLYLTLDGKPPSEESCGPLIKDIDFACLSYRKDIIDWLEKCRKEVAVLPILRESITQYIHLLKYLTNQTLNDTMKDELATLLLSNLEASFIIADNLDNSLLVLENKLKDELPVLADELSLEYTQDLNWNKNYTGFWFWKPDWKYMNIGFQFQNKSKHLVFGFVCKKNPTQLQIPRKLREDLCKLANVNVKDNDWWTYCIKMDEPFDDWDKYEAWKAISERKMRDIMREKILHLLHISDGLKL